MTFGKKLLAAAAIVAILYLVPSAVNSDVATLGDRIDFYRNTLSLDQAGIAEHQIQRNPSLVGPDVRGNIRFPPRKSQDRSYTFYMEYQDHRGNSFWADGRNPNYVEFGGRVSPSLWAKIERFFAELFGSTSIRIDFGR